MALVDNTVLILNAIRNAASTDYADRIPLATRDNITAVGNAISTYTPFINEFTDILISKIGLTIFSSKIAENKLARFKKGTLPVGKDIEDIFIEMAGAEGAYDAAGLDVFKKKAPTNIKVMYHKENRKDFYKCTVSHAQIKDAFRSEGGIQTIMTEQINALYSGANYDEYILMKNLLASYAANYATYEVANIIDEASAKEFVKTTRKAINDISYVSTVYNKAGVKTWTSPQDAVLLVNKDVIAEVDVEVLAKAFNMGKTDFEPTVIPVDDFGEMTDTFGLLLDKDFFMVYDTLREMSTEYNAKGLFNNYYLHIWQILSTSHFKNAIRFKKSTV